MVRAALDPAWCPAGKGRVEQALPWTLFGPSEHFIPILALGCH